MFKFVCFGRCQEKLLYQMLFDIETDVLQNPTAKKTPTALLKINSLSSIFSKELFKGTPVTLDGYF